MKKIKIKKFVAFSLIMASIMALNPVRTNAEWKKDNKGWWYTEGNSWATGWRKINFKWYYFGQDGYMEIGWLQDDDGKWYYLNNDGSMAHDTIIDGYKLGRDGSWINSNTSSSNYDSSQVSSLGQELLNNISMQNQSFTIEYTGNINNAGNVIQNEIDKLKYTNPYEAYNISSYKLQMYSWAGSNSVKVTVDCVYRMTAEMAAAVDLKAKSIVAEIAPSSMNQEQKERAIHDWIVNNTRYDQSFTVYDPYNTLVKHTGVCQGYSLLAQKMFTIAGIKSLVVEGTSKGQSHAWNLVYINGKWRHVDTTWDDPVSNIDILRYDYYNLTDKEIREDHSWDTSKYPKAD
ncbi:transglutaminase domain-containing protein [Clostridium sp. C2-6-12]|uniref:transglutaminase domain-containing protein n=1 Tax=Clostridium sp. C2-6-12 TaxID=2698832 RepID=UPI00136D5672|nr:transglutaminase domain-containing protein [Clostridium sp. C2-6-12]